MAMGKRPAARQASPMWVDTADLPTNDGHPYFERLNRVLADSGFDAFVEELCAAFYADRLGRPSLRPGRYFRMLFIGYFEGLSSERGIAWRVADSLSLRSFLDLELTEAAPDHSTLSRTRRRIDVETHEAVFTWILERLSAAGLVRGKTVGIDATTLEANAAMRSIERRDTENPTRRSFGGWRRRPGWRRRRGRIWLGSTGLGRTRRRRTRSGNRRRTMRASGAASVVKLAFEFLVLTAAGWGEVRGARWDEMDTTDHVWTVPAARMKGEPRAPRPAVPPRRGDPRRVADIRRRRRPGRVHGGRRRAARREGAAPAAGATAGPGRSSWLPVVVPGLGGGADRPPARGHRSGAGSCRPEQGRSRLRTFGPVRAAAAVDGRLGSVP